MGDQGVQSNRYCRADGCKYWGDGKGYTGDIEVEFGTEEIVGCV